MNKNKILIITHSKDNDGHLSGALCQYFEELIYGSRDISYLRWTYGDPDPDLSKENYQKIYLLDLTLSPYSMNYLINIYQGEFIWIDHHKANYEKIGTSSKIPGIRFSGCAACVSVWLYWLPKIPQEILNVIYQYNYQTYTTWWTEKKLIQDKLPELGDKVHVYRDFPYWLYLLGSYDIFRDHGNPELWENQVLPFEYYMRSVIDSPETMYLYVKNFFTKVSQGKLPDLHSEISIGKILLGSTRKRLKSFLGSSYTKDVLNEVTGKLVKVIIINTPERGSMIFESLKNKNSYDYFILWNTYERIEDGSPVMIFKYSAYSEKKDVLVPNLQIQGLRFGGHPHAGGAVSRNKPIL